MDTKYIKRMMAEIKDTYARLRAEPPIRGGEADSAREGRAVRETIRMMRMWLSDRE